jgi:hypothetical protein
MDPIMLTDRSLQTTITDENSGAFLLKIWWKSLLSVAVSIMIKWSVPLLWMQYRKLLPFCDRSQWSLSSRCSKNRKKKALPYATSPSLPEDDIKFMWWDLVCFPIEVCDSKK